MTFDGTKLDDFSSSCAVLSADLDCAGDRGEVDAWRHRELETASADLVGDVKHALAELDRRFVAGVENGVKVTGRHSNALSLQGSTAEPSLCAVFPSLSEDNCSVSKGHASRIIHRTELQFWKQAGSSADNELIPLLVIKRGWGEDLPACLPRDTAHAPRGAHSDWFH